MGFLTLNDIAIGFGGREILRGISVNLDGRVRMALAGANGSGKSTLMKIIAGQLLPDRGHVVTERDATMSYLPQSGLVHRGRTLIEEAESAFADQRDTQEEMRRIEEQMQEQPDSSALLERYGELLDALERSNYYGRDEKIRQVLAGLGFKESDIERDAGEFSGGWQMRIALAKILLTDADWLLLDEPTNYLDIEARAWLEDYITRFDGGVLLVSHDRAFLDASVDRVGELYAGQVSVYVGNYTRYEEQRAAELEAVEARYQAQLEEIEKTENFIRKFRYNASKAKMVQSRIKQLDKLERIDPPPVSRSVRITFPDPPHSGRRVLALSDIGQSFGDNTVFTDVDLEVERGDRIALVGQNGHGKSTLMKIMTGTLHPSDGAVKWGAGVEIGYFAQDHETQLTQGNTILDEVEQVAPSELVPKLRGLLGAFLFSGDEVEKKVGVLSGGERSRVSLLKLLLHPTNVLFLDEPTNHLDMTSTDILLEALRRYKGTLVFVSHDRYFISSLAQRVIEMRDGALIEYPGDFDYYLWKRERLGESAGDGDAGDQGDSGEPSANRDYHTSREERRGAERRERVERELLEQLDDLHARQKDLEARMADETNYTDGDRIKALTRKLEATRREEAALTERWESLQQSSS